MKRVLVGLIAVLMMFTLCACGPSQTQKDAFDSDDIIKGNSDSSYMVNSLNSTVGSKVKYNFETFYGIKTIKTFNSSGSIVITYDVNIKSGRFKLVLVGNDEIIVIAQDTSADTVTVGRSGTYKLKMVGDDAKASFTVNF